MISRTLFASIVFCLTAYTRLYADGPPYYLYLSVYNNSDTQVVAWTEGWWRAPGILDWQYVSGCVILQPGNTERVFWAEKEGSSSFNVEWEFTVTFTALNLNV